MLKVNGAKHPTSTFFLKHLVTCPLTIDQSWITRCKTAQRSTRIYIRPAQAQPKMTPAELAALFEKCMALSSYDMKMTPPKLTALYEEYMNLSPRDPVTSQPPLQRKPLTFAIRSFSAPSKSNLTHAGLAKALLP